MKTNITHNAMVDALLADEYANWSYEGADALISYLEDLELELGEDMDFDRVALRCEFTEYKTMAEACAEYGTDCYELRERTLVIDFGYYGVIVQEF